MDRKRFSINMHPHPSMLSKAYADFILKFGWKSFIIVYEDEESLVRLQEVIKFPKQYDGVRISMWQLDPFSVDYR